MDWFPRAFGIVALLFSGCCILAFTDSGMDGLEECSYCIMERSDGARAIHCHLTAPVNRLCPTCRHTWVAFGSSSYTLPCDGALLRLAVIAVLLPTALGVLRLARCPNCGGRPFVRSLRETVPWAPCLRCGGRGRVTLLNRWYVLRRG